MRYVIIGNNVYADMLYGYVSENADNEVMAFSVEGEYIKEGEFNNKPVVAYEEIEKHYSANDIELLLGVGYSQMNDLKERLFCMYKEKGYRFASYMHPSAIIAKDAKLGEGNVFFEGTTVQRGCTIGNGNVFFAGTFVAHNCEIGNFNSLSRASLSGNVCIKDKCFAGMGSVLGENITIENQVFIGANAYVNDDIQKERAVLGEKGKLIDREFSKRII